MYQIKKIRFLPTALKKGLQERNEKRFAVETQMRDYEFTSVEQKEKCIETY